MSYKTTDPLADLALLSIDEESWGKPVGGSFSTPGDGKGNIDGEGATSHVIITNDVAIPVDSGGLGADVLNLEKVVDFCNEKCSKVERPRSKYGKHRSGLRKWYYGSTKEYDGARADSCKFQTIVTVDGDRIIRKWFDFVAIDGKLYGRKRSCYNCPSCYDNDFLSCTQTVACGKYEQVSLVEVEGSSRSRPFVSRLDQPEGTELRKVSLHLLCFKKSSGFHIQPRITFQK